MRDANFEALIARRSDAINLDPIETLRALVHQIELSDFRDELGHRLKLNQAYLDAKAIVELMGATKGGPASPRR